MGGKHKKLLRSEKAKVKLKGAKLPKGLNVTKTEFKVKKIVIREQLADTGTGINSKKELNVKEILTRLKHHNSSFRMVALRSLKDLLNSNSSTIYRHLGQLIQGISAISLDIDIEIRRESYKVMSLLFSIVQIDAVRPFFEVISSYLRCAMTHIQSNIQEDSLLFLDVLIKYIPSVVIESGDIIFINFLDMISKLKEDHKQGGRALTANLNRIKTTKWRVRVLQRLNDMLSTILEDRKSKESIIKGNSYEQGRLIYYNNNQQLFVPILRSFYQGSNTIDILNSTSIKNKSSSGVVDDGERTKRFIDVLIPLLFELWLEVRPFSSRPDETEKIPLSADGAYTLELVLQIFECLWELIHLWERKVHNDELSKSWRIDCGENFVSQFCYGFPYERTDRDKDSKKEYKQSISANDPNCFSQNFLILFLFCKFYTNQIETQKEIAENALNYIAKILKNMGRTGSVITSYLSKTLRSILYENGKEFMQINAEKMRDLLRQVLSMQKGKRIKESHDSNSLILLCDIVLDDSLYKMYGQYEFQEWLVNLPELLCQPQISRHVLQTLCNLAKRKNKIFLESLKIAASEILGNLTSVAFVDYNNQNEGKKAVEDLLYWVNDKM